MFGLVEAARILTADGFKVFPYTTEDLGAAELPARRGLRGADALGRAHRHRRGASPTPTACKTMRAYFPGVPLVVDAGIGAPSHAAVAMEMGYDAVLLNTAVAKAGDPVAMAGALPEPSRPDGSPTRPASMEPRDMAAPSTPVTGTPFFELDRAS